MESLAKLAGILIAALSLVTRVLQEDLKRSRLRYYLRSIKGPKGYHSSALTVVNVGRTTASDVLVYMSPRSQETDEAPYIDPRFVELATGETEKVIGQSPEHNDLIIKFPKLHPSDRFVVKFAWTGGIEIFTRKRKDCFRITYEYGTSNKLFRMFGRVHRFWLWQRRKEDKKDAWNQPMFNSKQENPSQIELHISIDLVAGIKEKIK